MELRDYLRILRKRWIVIVLLSLVGLAAAAAASLLSQPTYRASSLVYVAVSSSGEVTELAQGSSFAQNQVKTFAETVSQPIVLEPVLEELGLTETAMELGKSVSASAPLDTSNIEIAVERNSAREAADLANAVTASFQQVVAEITQPTTGDPSPITVSVLRPATTPEEPASPNTRLNLALGLLVGIALGFGLAVLREVLDTRIRSVRDVEAITDTPVIGGISFDPDAAKRPLIVQADPRSPRAESFRTLRTNLQFLDIEHGPRTFVVTSSMQAEGKSTTAANLAIALADTGANVVLIDADLRRPKVAEYMGLEGAVGLSDTLIGRITLLDAVQPWGRGNLCVLPAGSTPPNPSELLGSQAMDTLLHSLEATFDAVIIDAPPLLPVTDGALLAKRTRGALLVVAAGQTHKGELTAAVAALNTVGAHIAGIVMTMLPTKGPDAYGYGGYGYGNTGYGYVQAPKEAVRQR
jgi:capsular exopolysaccharide synthesis family protein